MSKPHSYTYRDAGVDIDAGDALVERIKPLVKRTTRPEVLAGVGGFGAMVELPVDRYRRPVLVSGTDGVGTKLRLAIETGRHDTIGIDLVAMCANDVVVQGAEPLFFLDYYATGRLNVEIATTVISGIIEGCAQAGAALVGGETAEMPGMYQGEDYDLAGFCVGVVEKEAIIDGSRVGAGDAVIGLASSGPHSNGYSLIRKLIGVAGATAATQLAGRSLFDQLLTPTRIYVKDCLALRDRNLYSLTNRVAEVEYLELYAPLRLAGDDLAAEPRLFVSVPLLAQQEEGQRQLTHLRRHAILVTTALFALLAAVGNRLAQNFTRPITQLVEGTRRIAAGAPLAHRWHKRAANRLRRPSAVGQVQSPPWF